MKFRRKVGKINSNEKLNVHVVSKLKKSLQMKRYTKASKMFQRYADEEERSGRLKRKWFKKMRYYEKVFTPKPLR